MEKKIVFSLDGKPAECDNCFWLEPCHPTADHCAKCDKVEGGPPSEWKDIIPSLKEKGLV